jgi:hypothetical protein
MRLTALLGYIRLQCESIALLKLMSENSSVTEQWVNIRTDKDGKAFFQKYQKRVMGPVGGHVRADATSEPGIPNVLIFNDLHLRRVSCLIGNQPLRGTLEDPSFH